MSLNENFRKGLTGYLELSKSNEDYIPALEPGMLFDRNSDKPPWIIVDHNLETMTVANWPINLWKVQVLKPIEPQGHIGNYTRCSAIKVLESMPNNSLVEGRKLPRVTQWSPLLGM